MKNTFKLFIVILLTNFMVTIPTFFFLQILFPPKNAENLSLPVPSTKTLSPQKHNLTAFTTVNGQNIIAICNQDSENFCHATTAGTDQEACLQDHFQEVSDECKKSLQKTRDSFFPCKKEIEQKCTNIGYGGGRMLKCLREHFADLSKECQDRVY